MPQSAKHQIRQTSMMSCNDEIRLCRLRFDCADVVHNSTFSLVNDSRNGDDGVDGSLTRLQQHDNLRIPYGSVPFVDITVLHIQVPSTGGRHSRNTGYADRLVALQESSSAAWSLFILGRDLTV